MPAGGGAGKGEGEEGGIVGVTGPGVVRGFLPHLNLHVQLNASRMLGYDKPGNATKSLCLSLPKPCCTTRLAKTLAKSNSTDQGSIGCFHKKHNKIKLPDLGKGRFQPPGLSECWQDDTVQLCEAYT